jgi:hypothetical protein
MTAPQPALADDLRRARASEPGPTGPARKSSRWVLPALLLLLIASRGLLVLSLSDVFFWGEELSRGTAAKAMLDGLEVPHHQLSYNYFEGGAFAVSHLTVPAFLWLGPNLLAHKVVALLFAALILAAGFRFCERHLVPGSAAVFGLLFVFAPLSFQKLSLLNLGSHFATLLFLVLGLHFLVRALEEQPPRRATWLWLGFWLGAGISFGLQCLVLVAVAACALVWKRRRELFSRAALAGWLGLALGLAPLIDLALRVGFSAVEIHATSTEGEMQGRGIQTAPALLASIFGGRSPWEWLVLLALPAAAVLALRLARSGAFAQPQRRAVGALAAYAGAFLAAYAVTPFGIGEVPHEFGLNRLSPLWLAASLLAAAALPALIACRRPPQRALGACLLAALILGGALDTLRCVRRAPEGTLAGKWQVLTHMKGYTYSGFLKKLEEKRPADVQREIEVLRGFREPAPAWLRASITGALFSSTQHDWSPVVELLRATEPEHWQDYVLGLGRLWARAHGPGIAERIEDAAELPEEQRPFVYEAIGRCGASNQITEAGLFAEIRAGGPPGESGSQRLPDEYFRGVGYRMYEFGGEASFRHYHQRTAVPWCIHPAAAEAFIRGQDPRIAGLLLEGYRRAAAERML